MGQSGDEPDQTSRVKKGERPQKKGDSDGEKEQWELRLQGSWNDDAFSWATRAEGDGMGWCS